MKKNKESMDTDIVSSSTPLLSFPVVGIGASAGGLAAFESFFSGMPLDKEPGMSFILVQHLAPDHKSILSEIIKRYTRMQVFEVTDGMRVCINCAYIIPPNKNMALFNGFLQLVAPDAPRGQRLPIDYFFKSLASDLHEKSIGIILSGTGSDGTSGIKAIKKEGGLILTQTSESAEYSGMPKSAFATGLADCELAPEEMPARLIAYSSKVITDSLQTPPEESLVNENGIEEIFMNKIFSLIRSLTKHNFSQYKSSTIKRRIERRMAVHGMETIEDYLKFANSSSIEVEALFQDFLIGVTNFFRDKEAFKSLEETIIPRLCERNDLESSLRIWVPGCSTGEEAYSIAILLAEMQHKQNRNFNIQIFATDIDIKAIAIARTGLYSSDITSFISSERLSHFFTVESDGVTYRINKVIRDMLIISEQDVIKDPPFSKLDLISCRNLMIYMRGELQKRLIPLFHYALNPEGFLFLGSSETIGEHDHLFSIVDRKHKLYQRREEINGMKRIPISKFLNSNPENYSSLSSHSENRNISEKVSFKSITETAILKTLNPAAVLINRSGDILYLHGRTGLYLELPAGVPGVSNIFKMSRDGLKKGLTVALNKAVKTQTRVKSHGLKVKTNGDYSQVNLLICPINSSNETIKKDPLYLVLLEKVFSSESDKTEELQIYQNKKLFETDSKLVSRLKQELHAHQEYLQSANEELETSNEELKSSNEEMQSMNEELQSTNEELETSKEELQSVNEELSTVNAELQSKVAELSRINNDMNNLLAGTGIATVFVDFNLCILRYTPSTAKLINLISSDIGRPVHHILSNLKNYTTLSKDIQKVLDTLIPFTIEVETNEEVWYSLHIQPYRTLENVIEGAVITFENISLQKEVNANLFLAQFSLDSASDAVFWINSEGKFKYVNYEMCRLTGFSHDELLKISVFKLIPDFTPETFSENWNNFKRQKTVMLPTILLKNDNSHISTDMTFHYLEFEGKSVLCATAGINTIQDQTEEIL